MKLDSFKYCYNQGLPSEWQLQECRLRTINLIVGKNATGKSRTIKAINILSELLSNSGTINPQLGNNEWRLLFDIEQPEKQTEYILKIEKGLVIQEKLCIGHKELLKRDELGTADIFTQEIKRSIQFKIPKAELAVVKHRDEIQHPFLEDLYQWSNSLRFYEFGSQLGKDKIAGISRSESIGTNINFKDYNYVVGIFVLGKEEMNKRFTQAIISDMKRIGYNISEIGTKVPSFLKENIIFPDHPGKVVEFLYVQEEDLKSFTEQSEMSQGMFRALSLFIQINYSLLSSKPSCIVIDDIGEGLDYERSAAIIKILIEKAATGLVQLIMTTNDEFIMNGVPLEYWSVIERKSGSAKLHNIFNSKDKIEQFKFIGLNNFDFFTSEFVVQEKLAIEEE